MPQGRLVGFPFGWWRAAERRRRRWGARQGTKEGGGRQTWENRQKRSGRGYVPEKRESKNNGGKYRVCVISEDKQPTGWHFTLSHMLTMAAGGWRDPNIDMYSLTSCSLPQNFNKMQWRDERGGINKATEMSNFHSSVKIAHQSAGVYESCNNV